MFENMLLSDVHYSYRFGILVFNNCTTNSVFKRFCHPTFKLSLLLDTENPSLAFTPVIFLDFCNTYEPFHDENGGLTT